MFILSSFKKKKNVKPTLTKADIDFYKMSGVFAIVCVFVLLVVKMENTMVFRDASGQDLTYNFYQFFNSPVFAVIGALALVGAVAWFVFTRVKKIDESKRIFTSTNCLAIVLYLGFFAACFGIEKNSGLHGFFIAATVVLAAIYYISKFYNIDFTFYSVISACAGLAVYLTANKFGTGIRIVKVIIILAGIASCVLFVKNIKNLKVSKKRKTAFLTYPVYVPLALGALFLFWRDFIVNSPLSLTVNTMVIAIFVQYIVFAIIYTIRLIRE